MRVNLEGREIWIEFAYDITHFEPECPRESRDVIEEHTKCLREVTFCYLRDGSAPRGNHEAAPVIVNVSVTRCYLDPPNRDKARRAAIAKALDVILPAPSRRSKAGKESKADKAVRKAFRKLFWTAYLNRKAVTGKAGA